ncbi:MAG: glycine--tRNA ligase subunit beta [Methylococcus sp.]|nr:MAG: glycine--tRNA ligase subunit beta [Methylococcus sp.]
MSETRDVLFELGTEELPPKSLLTLSRALTQGVSDGLKRAGVSFKSITPYATPRRLAVVIEAVRVAQPDQDIERRGPALNAAFAADGSPSKALEGFLRSANATRDQLITLETDKGAWVALRQRMNGVATAELLPGILEQALQALPIAKRMRWGAGTAEFVRPVHWVVLLMGEAVVPADILGIAADRLTRGHRFHGVGSISLKSPGDYARSLLDQGVVMADFNERQVKITALAEEAAASVGGVAVIDPELLDEVTALVEWPVAILGSFESRFLALPAEVLITTMQANQKYFPVRGVAGELLPYFITFSNIDSTRIETVREGNERVVRPRLSDAEFFWNQDRKRTLLSRVEDLGQVTFQKNLGSVLEKTARVVALARAMAEDLGQDGALVARAARLAKADLLTTMVGEFPELQGIMGRYYALAEGERREVAEAIEEQYLPKVSGGHLPLSPLGQILALADKIDTLTGIFSAGLIPTGDKDPYALRRAALGVIRLSIESGIDLPLRPLLSSALSSLTHDFDHKKTLDLVETFILERLRGYCLDQGARPDEFEAVLAVRPSSLPDFMKRVDAVKAFRHLPEAESLAAANKRIRNLLKRNESQDVAASVDAGGLVEAPERELLAAAREARQSIDAFLKVANYEEALRSLASLKAPVDVFFDGVMVMAEDPLVRQNRLGLLAMIEGLFLDIADISRLQD